MQNLRGRLETESLLMRRSESAENHSFIMNETKAGKVQITHESSHFSDGRRRVNFGDSRARKKQRSKWAGFMAIWNF